ncbi:DUF5415 family protein [Streptomyces sp. NPDC057062]|uniref:DUF5415 family protein n=1 Tax=Streptomyces sp. NPDC057062 TaxID=3346011 RepID=UPI0036D28990
MRFYKLAGRKKESQYQKAAEQILKQKGIDINEWRRDVLNKRKLEIMSDQDKDWTEKTIDEEATKLVIEAIRLNQLKIDTNNPTHN